MHLRIKNKRDFLGGCTIAAFGVVGAVGGYRLGTGTLTQMGPGYVPLSLGVILIGLGLLMAVKQSDVEGVELAFVQPEWRGWICIIAGVIGFIVLGEHAGLVPATLACVFISAMGDRTATFKGAAILAVCITLFGVVLFHFVLQVPISLFWW